MSRSKKIQYKAEDIFKLTNNGYDIFKKEIGDFSSTKNIKSPLRGGDDTPSFRIKPSKTSGLWVGRDHGGSQWYGNGIQFIQQLYNLTFDQAIEKISNDLNISNSSNVYTKNILIETPKKVFNSGITIDWDIQKFQPVHSKYWGSYHLDEEFLNKEADIYAVKNWAINKKKIPLTQNEATFVYVYKDINGNETGKAKILRIGPKITKAEKWKNNVGPLEIWYAYKYINTICKTLFFAKANKDSAIFMKSNLCSITGNSENYHILTQLIPVLKELFPGVDIISVMGTDTQGKETSIKLTKEHNLKWFNTPNNVLEAGINDPAEYQKEFGEKAFQLLLKKKKFL